MLFFTTLRKHIPEIKFDCQEDKQLSNILELYFEIFQVRTIFIPWYFHID